MQKATILPVSAIPWTHPSKAATTSTVTLGQRNTRDVPASDLLYQHLQLRFVVLTWVISQGAISGKVHTC